MTGVTQVLGGLLWAVALAVLVAGLAFAYHWLRRAVPAFFRLRGERVVICPETRRPAGVAVDAGHAAATAFRREPELRLSSCSRWPEKADCGQECLRQIAAAPEDCLVRTMLTRWYTGKSCLYCGKPFATIHWHDHKPALLDRDGRTMEWEQVAAEDVPDALGRDKPVCWNCHIAETFRRMHPELVVDRTLRPTEERGGQPST